MNLSPETKILWRRDGKSLSDALEPRKLSEPNFGALHRAALSPVPHAPLERIFVGGKFGGQARLAQKHPCDVERFVDADLGAVARDEASSGLPALGEERFQPWA